MRLFVLLFLFFTSFPASASIFSLFQVPGHQILVWHGGVSWGNPDLELEVTISNMVNSKIRGEKPLILFIYYAPGGSPILHDHLIDELKNRVSHLTIVVGGLCASACAFAIPRADLTLGLRNGQSIRIHSPYVKIQDQVTLNREGVVDLWSKSGANGLWFSNNPQVFLKDNALYTLSQEEALDSGIIDGYINKKDLLLRWPLVSFKLWQVGWLH